MADVVIFGVRDLASLAQSGTSGSEDTLQSQAGHLVARLSTRLENVVTGHKGMIPIIAPTSMERSETPVSVFAASMMPRNFTADLISPTR